MNLKLLSGCVESFLILVWCILIPAVTIYFFCKAYLQ